MHTELVTYLNSYIHQGVRHEGTPEGTSNQSRDLGYQLNRIVVVGKIESIGTKHKVEVYVATPTGEYDKTKAVLYLSDVFGVKLINNKVYHSADSIYDKPFKLIFWLSCLRTTLQGMASRCVLLQTQVS